MPNTPFEQLQQDVNQLSQQLAKQNLTRSFFLGSLPLVGVVLTAAVYLGSQIGKANETLAAQGVKLTKLEGAIKALASNQDDKTQKLVHDLLSSALKSDAPDTSVNAAKAATSLTTALIKERRPAPPSFFLAATGTTAELFKNPQPEVRAAGLQVQLSLADYRSALNPKPAIVGVPIIWETTIDFYKYGGEWSGGTFDLSHLDKDLFNIRQKPISGVLPLIQMSTIIGGRQTLDGFRWRGVTFISTKIRYQGGPLELEGVNFINCTFEAPDIPSAAVTRVLQYATLDEKQFLTEA